MLGGAFLDLHDSGTHDFTEFKHLQFTSPTVINTIFHIHSYQVDIEAGWYSTMARISRQHIQGIQTLRVAYLSD